ncbi:S41 family peptidase [Ihubacter sp. rT4E-8]|uniref:S41 family peptidase n=1 Tax=unclassified Ihubacter TaxID=2633299 RepID=UPI003C7D48C7
MIKMRKRRFILLICGVVIATLLVASVGFFAVTQAKDMIFISKEDYNVLNEVGNRYGKLYSIQKTVEEQFLWDIDQEAQMEALYKALLDSLNDKYSGYMGKSEYEEWNNYIQGVFTGVGVVFIEETEGRFVVTKVISGSPAEGAGLKIGDVLLKVDGKAYDDSEEMALHIRGEEGSSVKLTYRRGNKVREAKMVRAQVEDPSVYAELIDKKYGYIRITAFERGTAEQFKQELAAFETKGVKGVVIDLRNNGGGLVDAGIEIADMLLPECTITHTEDKNGKTKYYNSKEDCTDLKYVVLVNGHSASTSEIVAAAIKDNKGGSLVGTTTFGKGIIQGTVEFKDGSAIKLTIQQYFSPNDKKIHGIGIKPDYEVKMSKKAKSDIQLEKALKLLGDKR